MGLLFGIPDKLSNVTYSFTVGVNTVYSEKYALISMNSVFKIF